MENSGSDISGATDSVGVVGAVYATGELIGTNLKQRLPLIIIGSLTLIATLAWNGAINALIDQYAPPEYKSATNAKAKFIYSFVLTVIIIIIISIIVKYFPK